MKAILKRNQIMITALAIMIAVAGYLNFAGNRFGAQNLTADEELAEISKGYPEETNAVEAISTLEAEYGLDGTLEISDEDMERASIMDIESLDEDITIADVGEMDEAMAEAGDMEDVVTASSVGSEAALQSDDQITEVPGEAVFTSSTGVNTLSGAKLLKEQTRAKNKEALLDIINNNALSEDQKQEAVDSMIAITDVAEKETAAEILLEAKGFEDVVVSISGDMADVVVGQSELTDAQRAQIEDVIKRKTGIAAENIIISPVIAN